MLKRLWTILGPVFMAALLVLLVLFLYPSQRKPNLEAEKKDAMTISETSFKNSDKKARALSDPSHEFVAFFGSSEWSRFDSSHPSVLSEAYNRPYTPYLLGERGTASLSHYFGMQPIADELQGKKAIFVVSPQWFTKTGINTVAFKRNFSSLQLVYFLEQATSSATDRYVAQRLLTVNPDVTMKDKVEKVAKGQSLSSWDKQQLQASRFFLEKEESLFGSVSLGTSHLARVQELASQLPENFSYTSLTDLAIKEGASQTQSNDFDIKDDFYNQRLKTDLQKFKGSQKRRTYIQSTEYNDFQVALSQLAKTKTNVLFVIPPVNDKWAAYTGLRQDMYQQTVAKIKYQLESQGFTNIADFSKDGSQAYFMQDTIHMGWTGWLAFDKAVYPFLTQTQQTPNYHLDDKFLDKSWADYTGNPAEFLTQD